MPAENHELSPPIVIVAPTQRCGTTLIQRAINSTGNSVIYGENFALLEKYPGLVAHFESRVGNPQVEAMRRRILTKDYDRDLSGLFPEMPGFASLLKRQFYDQLRYYNRSSIADGFHRWGIKHQIVDLASFSSFYKLASSSRFVFVYRDVIAAAQSAKARFGTSGETQIAEFSSRWVRNISAMRKVKDQRTLHLEYADLEADPDTWADAIRSHCSLDNMDPNVWHRRVNVSSDIDILSEGEAQTGYRRPAQLTNEERAIVLRIAGKARDEYGYR